MTAEQFDSERRRHDIGKARIWEAAGGAFRPFARELLGERKKIIGKALEIAWTPT